MRINEISYNSGAFPCNSKKDPEFAPNILRISAIFCQVETIKKSSNSVENQSFS